MSKALLRLLSVISLLFIATACSQSTNAPNAVTTQSATIDATKLETAPDWKTEYGEMTSVLTMTLQEQSGVQAAFRARDEVIAAWSAEHGARLQQLESEMRTAAKESDLAKVQSLTSEAGPLRNQLRELIATGQTAAHDALSPANQINWDGYLLAQRVTEHMQPLKLSQEQLASIRTEGVAAAQAVSEEENPAAAGYLKLEDAVEAKVLTPEQRAEFEVLKKKKPLRSLD